MLGIIKPMRAQDDIPSAVLGRGQRDVMWAILKALVAVIELAFLVDNKEELLIVFLVRHWILLLGLLEICNSQIHHVF